MSSHRQTKTLIANQTESEISMNKLISSIHSRALFGVAVVGLATFAGTSSAKETKPTPAKNFIDYFLPMPIVGGLSKDAWGAPEVGPRDAKNGLEDATAKQWSYWDGQIIKARDGKYHMFASRWDQALGHDGWKSRWPSTP